MRVYVVMIDYGVQNDFGLCGVYKDETDAIKCIEEESMTKKENWVDDNGTNCYDDCYIFYEESEVE